MSSLVTVQLGQCGNQLGCSLFQALAAEYADGRYEPHEVEAFFRPPSASSSSSSDRGSSSGGGGGGRHTARCVMIDMEPKVVAAAASTARRSAGGWWAYPGGGSLVQQGGAGNNWALGFCACGPRLREEAMDLVRREVEAADWLGGFLLLQSMAGGTGAGLGTYVSEALRDEFPSCHLLNACVWPHDSGEVLVQGYNSLLTLSHLAELSDGVVVLENDVLHKVCTKLHGIARPSFGDMNGVAARALASVLLPSQHRPLAGTTPGGTPQGTAGHTPGGAAHRSPKGQAAAAPGDYDAAGGAPRRQGPVRLLADVVSHLCCHPAYRLLTLRALPQLPAQNIDFTTFSWQGTLKRLRQMALTGSCLEEGLDWGLSLPSPSVSQPSPSGTPTAAAPGAGPGRSVNRSLANWVVVRGQGAEGAELSSLAEPACQPWWCCAQSSLMASCSSRKLGGCAMSAAMLSNEQSVCRPVQRMADKAQAMLASRAFVHQYEKYGLGLGQLEDCLARVEEVVQRYAML